MAKIVNTKEYLDMVCDLLAQGHTRVPVPVTGSSMVPFLHNGDMVYLDLPDTPLKRGDIVLYTRSGGQYVLHRIIRVCGDGSFVLVGDAQEERERVKNASRIHARVSEAVHKGRRTGPGDLRWKLFATVWIWVRPWRGKLMKLLGKRKNR